jgi:hypothetical protein
MKWNTILGVRPRRMPVWAAMCTGCADGSNPQYLSNVKHAILVMVRAPKPEAENAIYALLQSNGWRQPEIRNLKMLDHPYRSDDPIMRACHEGAMNNKGGIVIYSDPIEDS